LPEPGLGEEYLPERARDETLDLVHAVVPPARDVVDVALVDPFVEGAPADPTPESTRLAKG